MSIPKKNLTSFAMMLKMHLRDIHDPRQDDAEYISLRAEQAAIECERARLSGADVAQAMELANAVLMQDFQEES